MKSKLGFHIDIQGHPGQVEKMIRAEVRVIKVISSMGMLRDLHNALGDKTIFIARDWKVTDDFLRFGGRDNPKEAARRWLEAMRPSLVQAPFAYWESFNEMSHWDSMAQYGEFEAERQRLMHAEGFKACIGNFATGTPAISDEDGDGREDKWPEFYPALEAAHRFGNVLGLHEYGGLWMDLWYGPNQHDALMAGKRVPFPKERYEGWLFGRYRKVWRRHIEPNGWTNIRIVLTEFGLDMAGTYTTDKLAGYTVGSWKTAANAWAKLDGRKDTEQYYVEQLKWCDYQMQKDPFIYGCAIFTWGTIGDLWRDFEIEGKVADALIAYIDSTEGIDTRPVTGGEQPPKPGGTSGTSIDVIGMTFYNLNPTPKEGLRVRSGPGTRYEAIALVHPGDKLGALESKQDVLNKLGKQNQWVRVRIPSGEEGYVAAWLVEPWTGPKPQPRPSQVSLLLGTIASQGTIVRSGPGSQYDALATVFIGDKLEALDNPDQVLDKLGRPGEWLKVRTPRGINGYVPTGEVWPIHEPGRQAVAPQGTGAVVSSTTIPVVPITFEGSASAGSSSTEVPVVPITFKEPAEEKGPLYLRTTASDGLNLRAGPGSQHRPVASAFPADKLEAIGDRRDILERLGLRGQWIQVKTPRGEIGWGAAWYLERWPDYFVWPGGHALAGLHGPADPGAWPWDEGAYQIIREARIEAVKLLAAGDIGGQQVKRLQQLGVRFIMARLFAKFTEKRTPQDFVREVADAALRLYDNGVRYFEVHNEPNVHTPDSPEGQWVVWQNGREFGEFFQEAVKLLRDLMPGAQFGWPGVSPGGDVPKVRYASERFEEEAKQVIRTADFYCMHAYWGADGSSYLDALGKIKTACDRYPDKLILVTEFSNSSPYIGKDIKAREYAQFYVEAKRLPPNLGAMFSYLLSASKGYQHETWRGSSIAAAVGKRKVL